MVSCHFACIQDTFTPCCVAFGFPALRQGVFLLRRLLPRCVPPFYPSLDLLGCIVLSSPVYGRRWPYLGRLEGSTNRASWLLG
jgi:hypothetical protein